MNRILPRLFGFQLKSVRRYSCRPNKRLILCDFGDPKSVLKLEQSDVDSPKDDEILVEMLLSSINPADINTIQGTYPIKPTLPGVPGHEGVGKVLEIGSNVSTFKPGDLVIPNIVNFGCWENFKVVKSGSLLKVPQEVPLVELCGVASNTSTAYRMLNDFVPLKNGDTVIQNGANSAAGQNVIQLCKAWGIKSVNIVRNRPDIDELKAYLTTLGADVVLTEEELRTTKIFKDGTLLPPKLAINCVGGKNAMDMIRHLSSQGVMVTYGGMSKEPVMVPTSLFIFKDIALKGFWMTRWNKANRGTKEHHEMLEKLFDLMIGGKLKAPAHRLVPIDNYAEALESMTNAKGFRGIKLLLDFRT